MEFRVWLERAEVLAHVGGASGSGKTTLVDKIARNHKHLVGKDLDDFDDAARALLGWSRISKNDYTDKMFADLAKKKQELLKDFLDKESKPVVLAGHHTEGGDRMKFRTKNKFYLDVDAETCAQRQYDRGRGKEAAERVTQKEIPRLRVQAQKDMDTLARAGYLPRKENELLGWLKSRKNP